MKTTHETNDTMAEMKVETAQPVVVTQIAPAKLTLTEVRAKLDGKTGKRFWKSLDELADTPEFNELMREEFPRQSGAGESHHASLLRTFVHPVRGICRLYPKIAWSFHHPIWPDRR